MTSPSINHHGCWKEVNPKTHRPRIKLKCDIQLFYVVRCGIIRLQFAAHYGEFDWAINMTKLRKFIWVFALLCALQGSAQALGPVNEQGLAPQYTMRRWSIDEGLSTNELTAIAQAEDGAMWIGSSDGLMRFDGFEFITYRHRDHPELQSDHIVGLCVTPDSTLWIAHHAGVSRFQHGDFVGLSFGKFGRNSGATAIVCRSDNSVWVGSDTGELLAFTSNSKNKPLSIHSGLGSAPTAIELLPDGSTLIATWSKGLFSCDKNQCRALDIPLLRDRKINGINVSGFDVSIPTEDPSIHLYGTVNTPMPWRIIDFRKPSDLDEVVTTDSKKNVRGITSPDSMIWINDRQEQPTSYHSIIPKDSIFFFNDREENSWHLSPQHGLVRLSASDFRMLPFDALGIKEKRIFTATKHPMAGILVASKNAVMTIRNDEISKLTSIPEASSGYSAGIHGSRLFVGTREGLLLSESGNFEKLAYATAAPKSEITGTYQDRIGRVWLMGPSRPFYFLSDRWRELTSSHTGGAAINGYLERKAGDLLFATAGAGLFEIKSNTAQPASINGTPANAHVNAMLEDSDARLWVAIRDHGLFFEDHGNLRKISDQIGLPMQIRSMIEDRLGNFWFCGPNRIYRVPKAELVLKSQPHDQIAQPLALPIVEFFNFSCETAFTSQISALDENGVPWFLTRGGLLRYLGSTSENGHRQYLRDLRFTKILADGVTLLPTRSDGIIGNRFSKFEFHFTGIELTKPERTRFYYRLIGASGQWVGLNNRREVMLQGLNPGKYGLEVCAIVGASLPDENCPKIRYPFQVKQRFVESFWFYTMIGAAVLLPVFFWLRLRFRHMRWVLAEALQRNELAQDLHDYLAQRFSGMIMRLDAALSMVPSQEDGLRFQLLSIEEMTREAVDEIRQVVKKIRVEHGESSDLIDNLKNSAERQLKDTGKQLAFQRHGPECVAAPLQAFHIRMVVSEAISNALYHSPFDTLLIQCSYERDLIKISVRDAGNLRPNFRPRRSRGGSGLIGMQERAKAIGGKLDVITHPNNHFEVILVVDIALKPESEKHGS